MVFPTTCSATSRRSWTSRAFDTPRTSISASCTPSASGKSCGAFARVTAANSWVICLSVRTDFCLRVFRAPYRGARHHTTNHTAYTPYIIGGEGAPLLREKVVREAAAAASAFSSREVTEAQLLVKFVRSVGAVAIPRSCDVAHQAQNADVGLDVQLPPELIPTLEALEANRHYDWDPTDVP